MLIAVPYEALDALRSPAADAYRHETAAPVAELRIAL